MAEFPQFIAGSLVTQFGFVAQGEQGLMAARVRAGAGDGQYLFSTEIGPLPGPWGLREGAVVADVATQFCQRDKTLGE